MKHNRCTPAHQSAFQVTFSLLLLANILLLTSCKKEVVIQPTEKDVSYLSVADNPGDSVDHAIFQFYEQTGIAVFYNDTIARGALPSLDGAERFSYTRLAVAYSPFGFDNRMHFSLPESKENVIQLLTFLKEQVLPRIPKNLFVPSILLVDSLIQYQAVDYPQTVNAYRGFNTLAIRILKPDDLLTPESQKKYLSDILTSVITKKVLTGNDELKKWYEEFVEVSGSLATSVYLSHMQVMDPSGTMVPEDFGFIYYYDWYNDIYTPDQQLDLNTYISAVFYYSPEEFNNIYANYPFVLQKFEMVQSMINNYFP